MELVLVKLITSISIIKEVSLFYMASCIMFTLSVPSITPAVSVIPVINGQQVSINLSIDVSSISK